MDNIVLDFLIQSYGYRKYNILRIVVVEKNRVFTINVMYRGVFILFIYMMMRIITQMAKFELLQIENARTSVRKK